MPYSSAAKNLMLQALGVASLSLHTANPGATGTSEVVGGTPAYQRKAVTGATAASAGSKLASASVSFDVPAVSVGFVGYWSADATPVWLGYDDIPVETFGAQGVLVLTTTTVDLNVNASA